MVDHIYQKEALIVRSPAFSKSCLKIDDEFKFEKIIRHEAEAEQNLVSLAQQKSRRMEDCKKTVVGYRVPQFLRVSPIKSNALHGPGITKSIWRIEDLLSASL